MKIEMELWHVIVLLTGFAGTFWALTKAMVAQNSKHIDAQFASVNEKLKGGDDASRRIERELMELKAELPRDYVRREDHNRVVASLLVSIDNLHLKLDKFMLQRGAA